MTPAPRRRRPPADSGRDGGRAAASRRGAGAPGSARGSRSQEGAGARGAGNPNQGTGGRGNRRQGAGAARTASGAPPRGRSAPPAGLGGEQVEGRRAVRELLIAGRRQVRELWLAAAAGEDGEAEELEELARSAGVPVRAVGPGRVAASARTAAPQGVLAFAEPLPEVDLVELVTGAGRPGVPFLVVLDGVTDPHNLGAVLRAAECAGATGVVVPRHRAAHVTPTVAKVAAGAVEHLPIALVGGVPTALTDLSRLGVWTVGLAADGGAELFGLELATAPLALVLGSEGRGLSRLARARCDVVARLPLAGALESLNVASAAAVACFEVLRQREASAGASRSDPRREPGRGSGPTDP